MAKIHQRDDGTIPLGPEPDFWPEGTIFNCVLPSSNLDYARDIENVNACENKQCRCCAAVFTSLVRRGKLALTSEMVKKAPSDKWKQIMAKAAILAMLERT